MTSIRSVTAVLIRLAEFNEQTVWKVWSASRAISACFLREDSDGMVEMSDEEKIINPKLLNMSVFKTGRYKRKMVKEELTIERTQIKGTKREKMA